MEKMDLEALIENYGNEGDYGKYKIALELAECFRDGGYIYYNGGNMYYADWELCAFDLS